MIRHDEICDNLIPLALSNTEPLIHLAMRPGDLKKVYSIITGESAEIHFPLKLCLVFTDINERYDVQHRRVPRIPAKAIWWRHGLGVNFHQNALKCHRNQWQKFISALVTCYFEF
ncbi:MAG: hypothetical protein H0W62_14295 [Chitinophagales bacterium]|nr:hypothetical protein [Chitinophagales bacterium]